MRIGLASVMDRCLTFPQGKSRYLAQHVPDRQFARLGGISAKQLRAYDALGLFRPVWVDPSSGYRYYSPAQLPELRRILALRQLGMPLDEIGVLARGGDMAQALDRRREVLERERRIVEDRLIALDITVSEAGGADVVLRPIAVEPVAVMAVDDAVEDAFYELESHVRDVGRRAHRPPGAIPAQREIFVPVSGPVPETDDRYRRLPAVRVDRSSIAGHTRCRQSAGGARALGGGRRPHHLQDRCARSTSPSARSPSCASRPAGSFSAMLTS